MKDFNNKVAVVTGAGGGVGRSLCIALAQRGMHLALVDISADALVATAEACAGTGVRLSQHVTDISDKAQMAALPAAVTAEHQRVDLLVNNAGITYQKSFATHTIEDWERIVGINWWGVLYGCHYFLPLLKQSGDGHIVNMSSMAGMLGLPGQTSYCATKSAVRMLSEALWVELKKENVGVTTVHPGAVKTDMIQATLKQSDDVAAAQRNYRLAQKIGVTPEHVAERIITAIEKKSIRIRVGKDSILLDLLKRWFPVGIQKLMTKIA
ncbi:Putative oxidoreductase SadH [Sinobacterium norvegicum]|uniref:Oxidoreductase SadH n=1 Tax=Sinobacterium norvegicum TaxID=1641715 RepID=A0ABN8EHM6_9GAMM|nr:SDR family oxidoreductase [Sinobacterium norvegicum]CAH0991118.1 Putative oxidoreductase SadH [Sinobacterium norvegicum]